MSFVDTHDFPVGLVLRVLDIAASTYSPTRPRTGFVERALIAAYAGELSPILCLTKSDLAPPEQFADQFADLDLTITTAGRDDPLDVVAPLLGGKVTVLLRHSGVGKPTLMNRLVPEADRATGDVSGVAKDGTRRRSGWRCRCGNPAG